MSVTTLHSGASWVFNLNSLAPILVCSGFVSGAVSCQVHATCRCIMVWWIAYLPATYFARVGPSLENPNFRVRMCSKYRFCLFAWSIEIIGFGW